jgi:ABC-type transport system substrate-binding protein
MEKNGTELSFQLLSPSQDPYPAMGQLVQDQLAQVGIKTNIVMQVQASVTLTRRQGGQGIYLGTYGILDPMGSMNILFGCSKIPSPANPLGTNITFWCNRQFDRDIIASQKLLGNEAARNVRLVRASKALADAHVSMTLFQPQTVVFAKKSIQGVALQPDGILKLNDLTPGT